jgi:type 2 lantibiotic biosynthesis protein LanM
MPPFESPETSSLENRLLFEGWSLSQRLSWIANHEQRKGNGFLEEDPLQSWKKIVAPHNQAHFDRRLAWDGISPEAAASALQPGQENFPTNPSWWTTLTSIRQAAIEGLDPLEIQQRCAREPFVHAWRPAAAWALLTLKERCCDLESTLSLSSGAWIDLAEGLLVRLCNTAGHALWEKFNERRTPGQMLIAHLGSSGDGSGEPIREVYDAFIAELLSSGYALLLADFPVLGRLLSTIVDFWLEGTTEMLERIAANRAELREYFGIDPDAVLRKVQLGLSDPHRGGRAVAIVSFEGEIASDFAKVVYKPKDMQLDRAYQDFLRTINHSSVMPPLRTLVVLPCKGYGFMEWVEHRPCGNDEELERFYTNAGRHIAVLHLLGCSDCHYENLIACDDQLMLIDSETLFNSSLVDVSSGTDDPHHMLSDAQISMEDSVLRIGLLPNWTIEGTGRKFAFDISALGITPTPEREMPGWLAVNSDGMIPSSIKQSCELPTSLPIEMGSPPRLMDFVEQLCAGFTQQLLEAMSRSTTLIGALVRFKGLPRRQLARSTRLYFAIQQRMLRPASLRSAVAHGLVLEQLSRCFVSINKKPNSWPMFQAEVLQMEQLDIPLFEHQIDSEDLPLPHGLAPIRGYWLASGLESAKRRLSELDCDEIGFQEQLIRGSITASQLKADQQGNDAGFISNSGNPQLGEETGTYSLSIDGYRHEAFRLGEELWSDAIRDRKGRPEWLGIDLGVDGGSFKFGLVGNSLYSGASGIALLFARLALSSPDPASAARWRERAWSCFARLAELSEGNSMDPLFRKLPHLPYGLHGTGGILLALQLLSQEGSTQALQLAEKVMQQLRPERLQADESFDVLGGVAGLIGPLLLLGTPQALELALICGDRLVDQQLDSGGWVSSAFASKSRPALTGFSHGAAGIAAALSRLAQVTGENRFAESARRAVAYEREVFVVDKGWPDFRSSNESSEFMLSWCHGAPGILLSRQILRSVGLADDTLESELHIARSITVADLENLKCSPGNPPAHLCCGVLGLTSLIRIVDGTNGTLLDPVVPHAEALLVSRARSSGGYKYLSVSSEMLNLPGLLSGKAGVALALLEAVEGLHWIPQVLSAGLHEFP